MIIANNELKYPVKTIDICVVTYNRIEYLKKCIWSIIASTKIPFRINVIDDCSMDGTQEWLISMQDRGLINTLILNNKRLGTANNFNKIIDISDSKWFVMVNDDMYFHRWWDLACFDVIENYVDCGIVSFYNYTRLNVDKGNITLSNNVMKVSRTGLGACMMNRDSFEMTGKFILGNNRKMGYFATPFCNNFRSINTIRNKIYSTIMPYAIHMDYKLCKLNEIDSLEDYRKMRSIEKNRK